MRLKPILLAAAIAIGIAGIAQAGNQVFAQPSPDKLLSLSSEQLDLNPAQQEQLRPLLQQAIALRVDIRNKTVAMRAATRAELDRPDVDLRALSSERQAMVAGELKSVDALRSQFLAYYQNQLSPSQQARARQLLLKRMDRFDRLRERIMSMSDAAMLSP